ncbi:hypothetical protein WJX84_008380 [Apatococcus fuscideae]|uniref:AAA+ ATPase domain-containing protein n=1 Tax=Apatococcus fuscideae TaxID=2026836 RepID=A0AAW1T5L1_9CHLO
MGKAPSSSPRRVFLTWLALPFLLAYIAMRHPVQLLIGFHRERLIRLRLLRWIARRSVVLKLSKATQADPANAEKFERFITALSSRRPAAVVSLVEARSEQITPGTAIQYLKAMVATKRLDSIALPDVNSPLGEQPAALGHFLQRLQGKLQPGGQAIASSPTSPAGTTGPIQIVLQDSLASRQSSGFLGVLRNFIGVCLTTGSTAFSPKEYAKAELPEKSVKSFKDVKGCDEAKGELEEVVEYLKNPAKFTRLGAKLPKGVLLTGPPGTGKTLMARAVAGEANVPFFFRAGSEFEEMFVGVGSRRMRTLFEAAKKKAPCIVFIDEIDAIGGNRKQWENHSRSVLNQMLIEMDGFETNENVIVMAATNIEESLDPALTRPGRFDRHVAVPLPDVKGRREILSHYLADKPLAADVDAAVMARRTPGFSGAELSNLVNEAALLAAKSGAANLTSKLLDQARDKVIMGVERSLVQTEEDLKMTAYHEAGHALVALATPGAMPIHKATVVPRGHALGMVSQVPENDSHSMTKRQLTARIDVAMGGKAAEELIFGADNTTTGVTSDLQQATSLARHMVTQCGMSSEFGPVYVSGDSRGSTGFGPETQRRVDNEISRILQDSYARVQSLLRQRADDLQLIAQALLANETLDRDQIQEVLAGTLPKQALAVPERASPAQLSAPRPSGPADEAATPEVSTSGRSDGAGSNPSSGPAAPQEAAPPGSSIGSAEAQPDLAAGKAASWASMQEGDSRLALCPRILGTHEAPHKTLH